MMTEKIFTMVANVSVLLLPILIILSVRRRLDQRPLLQNAILGAVFSLVGLVVMHNAVQIVPGIRTDPRGAVVVLAAAFAGPLGTAITATCLSIMRILQGGVGAFPGVTYIIGLAVFAVLIRQHLKRRGFTRLDTSHALLFAAIAFLLPPVILLFTSNAPWDIFLTANALSGCANFFSVLLIATLLIHDDERTLAIAEKNERMAQIRAIAENAPAVLFQVCPDVNGNPYLKYATMAAENILGHKPDKLIGVDGIFFEIFESNTQSKLRRIFEPSCQNIQGHTEEVPYIHPTGKKMWLRIDAGPRSDALGLQVWDGTIFDVTQHHIAEETKDNFVSVVSHELRTPLTSIRGALGLVMAQKDVEYPAAVTQMLDIASRNAERLVRLVNDILDIQKIRSGQMQFDVSAQPIRAIVDSAIASTRSFMPEKSIEFSVDEAEENHAPSMVDGNRLLQVLHNLLSNAVKFAPPNSQVTVTLGIQDNMRLISVADQGPGVPESFLSSIFGSFQQAQSSRSRNVGGTGLGLNISRTFVEAMGGKIWYEAGPKRGAIFHVALPLCHDEIQEEKGLQDRKNDCGSETTFRDVKHIVYAESDPALSDVVRLGLEEKCIKVDLVQTADALQSSVAKCQYDLILTDVEFNGVMHDSIIANLPKDVPVVVFAASEPTLQLKLYVRDWFVKSQIPEHQLIDAVVKHLGVKRINRTDDAA